MNLLSLQNIFFGKLKTAHKNYFSVLYVIALALGSQLFFSCVKDELPAEKDLDKYIKLYGGYYDEHVLDAALCLDNSTVACGTTTSWGAEFTDGYVVKTTPYGNLQWSKVFKGTHQDAVTSVKVNTAGDILLVGTISISEDTSKMLMARYSSEGVMIDSLIVDEGFAKVEAISIVALENNQYLFTANTANNIPQRLIAIVTDENLSIVSTNILGLSERYVDFSRMTLATDGSIIAIGNVRDNKDNTNIFDTKIIKIKDNNIVWEYNYGIPLVSEKCTSVAMSGDDICVTLISDQTGEEQYNLLKLSLEGNLIELQTPVFETNQNIQSLLMLDDNTIAGTGFSVDGDNSLISLVITTSDGEVLLQKPYMGKGLNNKGVILLDNPVEDGFTIVGDCYNENNFDILIVRTDLNGEWL